MLISSPLPSLINPKRWPNFTLSELICHCGIYCRGEYYHHPYFLDCLQALREEIGKPLILNSAHRCALWNAQIGGAPLSEHKKIAVDISLKNQNRKQILQTAKNLGFTGFGLYQTFLHLDQGRPRVWIGKNTRTQPKG